MFITVVVTPEVEVCGSPNPLAHRVYKVMLLVPCVTVNDFEIITDGPTSLGYAVITMGPVFPSPPADEPNILGAAMGPELADTS